MEVQEKVAESFARSVDFSRIAAIHKAIVGENIAPQLNALQKQLGEPSASLINFSALSDAVSARLALNDLTSDAATLRELSRGVSDSLARAAASIGESSSELVDLLAQVSKRISFELPTIDIRKLYVGLSSWLPSNLATREVLEILDEVARLTFEEGIPLSWVPRPELVLLLIEADGPDTRIGILSDHCDEILDDCERALGPITHEWALQCHSAIAAMRADLEGPAQSHASNIIDSIILGLHGRNGREHAKAEAQGDFDDLQLQFVAEHLTLRPLFLAFAAWYPNSGDDPPNHFARHPTSHAVGHEGVFSPFQALVAVMLATSLTVQYASEYASAEGAESHSLL